SIVDAPNEAARAIVDLGLTPVLHQHTGTCVETREETYAVMEAVDTRYLKFGPDIGQLQKGGSDPVKVVKDFLPVVHHMHLKDYAGGDAYVGYCPLGQGKVDIPAILTMMDGREMNGMIMVELDSSANMPTTPLESATRSSLGRRFASTRAASPASIAPVVSPTKFTEPTRPRVSITISMRSPFCSLPIGPPASASGET